LRLSIDSIGDSYISRYSRLPFTCALRFKLSVLWHASGVGLMKMNYTDGVAKYDLGEVRAN